MSVPVYKTLSIYQGQTFDDVLLLLDDDGAPRDLTGFSAQMQAREDVTSTTAIVDWGTDTGEIVLGGAAGTATFAVTAAATQALPTANDIVQWVYDLRIYNTADPVYAERVVQGALVIYPAVTR